MLTYLNKENKPIIRRCGNCVHFNLISAIERTGYCKQMPMLFAFTGEQTVFGITKTFYYCDDHEMTNEDFLKNNAIPVEIDLKSKNELNGSQST